MLIAIQNIGKFSLSRPAASTIGVALLLSLGVLSFDEAVRAIDFNTIVLLFGMMALVAYLSFSGFFEFVASKLMTIGNGRRLLLTIILSSSTLSALFVNDTICVFMTPIIVKLSLEAKLNPIPLLIALATSANIGSAGTIIGNPQNMLIGISSGVSFLEFAKVMVPISAICLVLNYLIVYAVYRKDFDNFKPKKIDVSFNKSLAVKTLAVFAFVLALFITEIYPIPISALIGAAIMFAIGKIPPRKALEKVDWGLLLFFCNLFIVMHAFERDYGHLLVSSISLKDLESYLYASTLTVIGSNLVSNVPFVMMMLPIVKQDGEFWYLLAMSSTFAGNLTLIGSVANLIVAESASREGINLGFIEYLKVGVPLTVSTVLVGALMIYCL